MQATAARQIGLLVALGGAALYFSSAGKPDHKLATVGAIATVFSGLLFIVVHELRRADRNRYGAVPGELSIPSSLSDSLPPSTPRVRTTLTRFPRFLLFTAVSLMIMLAVAISAGPWKSKGLWVFLTQRLLAKEHLDPAGPVVVILKAPRKSDNHSTARIFVNEREIDWRNLRGALLSQLSRRADWVVFIDADPSLPYADAVQVVAVVSELSAKPVLLSRKLTVSREPPNTGHDSQYSTSQPRVIFRAIADTN